MKALYTAILATILLAPAGGALADHNDSGAMESGKSGSANTQENSLKAEGGTAADSSTQTGQVSNTGDDGLGAQSGTANTEEGSLMPEGGSAAGEGGTGPVQGEPATGPDEDMSTQTGTANTEVGSTKPQGGTATE